MTTVSSGFYMHDMQQQSESESKLVATRQFPIEVKFITEQFIIPVFEQSKRALHFQAKINTCSKSKQLKLAKTVAVVQSLKSGADARELLDKNVKAPRKVLDMLSKESIFMANKIVKTLSTDDPGLVVQITDSNSLHAALGLEFSPVVPGADVAASVVAFKNWLIDVAHAALGPAAAQKHLGAGLLAWHHLSEEQAHRVIINWSHIPWLYTMRNHEQPEFAVCMWMTGTGVAKAHMFARESVFHYLHQCMGSDIERRQALAPDLLTSCC